MNSIMINNLKFILLFIPFMVNSQAREVAKISPLGKLTARLDVGMDSKYYIYYVDSKIRIVDYCRTIKIGNKKKLINFKKSLLNAIKNKEKNKKIILNKNIITLNSSGNKRVYISITDKKNITSGIKWLSIKQINVLIPESEF